MAAEILKGPLWPKTFGGEDCTSCECPVYWVCDCDLETCLLDFYDYTICQAKEKVRFPLWQVTDALNDFMGFASIAIKIQPSYDYDVNLETGTPENDYGRTYLRSLIRDYNVQADFLRAKYAKILKYIDPGDAVTSSCNTCDNPVCTTIHCLLQTLRDFIGLNQDPKFRGDLDLFVRPDRCCEPDLRWCGECP